jgi:hypothetical protein
MKEHILAALREQFERWEQLLSSLDEKELNTRILISPGPSKTWCLTCGHGSRSPLRECKLCVGSRTPISQMDCEHRRGRGRGLGSSQRSDV